MALSPLLPRGTWSRTWDLSSYSRIEIYSTVSSMPINYTFYKNDVIGSELVIIWTLSGGGFDEFIYSPICWIAFLWDTVNVHRLWGKDIDKNCSEISAWFWIIRRSRLKLVHIHTEKIYLKIFFRDPMISTSIHFSMSIRLISHELILKCFSLREST